MNSRGAVWLSSPALVLPEEGHVQAAGRAESLRAGRGTFILRDVGSEGAKARSRGRCLGEKLPAAVDEAALCGGCSAPLAPQEVFGHFCHIPQLWSQIWYWGSRAVPFLKRMDGAGTSLQGTVHPGTWQTDAVIRAGAGVPGPSPPLVLRYPVLETQCETYHLGHSGEHRGQGHLGKEVSNSQGDAVCSCCRLGSLQSHHRIQASEKIQHPLPLTRSSTSSFFPVVVLESFPGRGGRPLGAQGLLLHSPPRPRSVQEFEEGRGKITQ